MKSSNCARRTEIVCPGLRESLVGRSRLRLPRGLKALPPRPGAGDPSLPRARWERCPHWPRAFPITCSTRRGWPRWRRTSYPQAACEVCAIPYETGRGLLRRTASGPGWCRCSPAACRRSREHFQIVGPIVWDVRARGPSRARRGGSRVHRGRVPPPPRAGGPPARMARLSGGVAPADSRRGAGAGGGRMRRRRRRAPSVPPCRARSSPYANEGKEIRARNPRRRGGGGALRRRPSPPWHGFPPAAPLADAARGLARAWGPLSDGINATEPAGCRAPVPVSSLTATIAGRAAWCCGAGARPGRRPQRPLEGGGPGPEDSDAHGVSAATQRRVSPRQ